MKDFSALTERELEILELAKEGKTNKEIGEKLYISFHTVKAHLASINRKLSTNNKIDAIIQGIKAGYIKI